MPHQLFLSHDSRDRVRAGVLATAITRMTLGQITVWHSSDGSGTGGLQPGHVWLDEIRTRLAASKAVVALLTPTSIARPWLLFESGFRNGCRRVWPRRWIEPQERAAVPHKGGLPRAFIRHR